MNRQEAIRILKKELEITKDIDKRFGDFPEHREALEMAISSLEAEPCEDCISRHKAIVMVTAYEGKSAQIEALKKLSSVYPKSEQEPKTGHWIKGYTFPDGAYWKCDKCNELIKVKIPMRYCNNCGAKMVEPQESEDKE